MTELNCEDCGGKCCRYLMFPVTWFDLQEADLLQARGKITPAGKWVVDAPCPHLFEERCSIYAARPETCKKAEVGGFKCLTIREATSDE